MRRRWYRSRWVRATALGAFVLLLVTVAAPFLIPADSYRQLLVDAIESSIGRQVRIDTLHFSVLPKFRLHMTGFYIQNPADFPAGDALAARSVDLGIALRPLLSRQLRVTFIEPSGVQINLLRNAAGRTNVAITPLKKGARNDAASVLAVERIGAVNITDAAVTLTDLPDVGRPALELSGVNAKIRSIDPGAADWLKRLTLTADLSRARLTTPLLTKPLLFRTGNFSFKDGSGRGTFSLTLGDVSIAGAAAIGRIDPLSITFAVNSPALDLDALATLVRPSAEVGLTPHQFIASGSVAVEHVTLAPFETTRNTAHVELSTSAVRLDRYALRAYGGTVHGSALFDGTAGGLHTSGTAQAAGINVEQALAALGFRTRSVTGTAQANLRFTTTLAHDPKRALTATGAFVVRNGAFPGLDVKGELADVARLTSINLPSGETSFTFFGGDLRIADERAYSNDLRLIATGLQATSRGSFGFDQTLSYTGTGVVDALSQASPGGSALVASLRPIVNNVLRQAVGATRVQIPFSLHGTLENPQFALAGTPQLSTSATPAAARAPAGVPSSVQDLINLIPGL